MVVDQRLDLPQNQPNNFSALEYDEAKQNFEILHEMSQILNCGLDQKSLHILVGLIENGVNPEALAVVVKELKRETAALRAEEQLQMAREQQNQ